LSETDPSRIATYPSACSVVPGLSNKQRELCIRHPVTMKFLIDGLRMAISECQQAFSNQVWNCTLTTPGVGTTPLKIASKESAFVYAIASAGVSHSLAKACAKGLIDDCGCGPIPSSLSNKFVWAGCSDNVRYGNSFGRKFIDVTDKVHTLMNLHNNRVGRRLLASRMGKECKCHGVSGSCVTKTCWKVVPRFDEFSELLMHKYEMAQQVTVAPHGTTLMVREPVLDGKRDLVYLDSSPDYCSVDTRGRHCGNNCDEICCGRGWDTVREVVDEPCQCRFIWCCDVKCKTCKKIVDRNFCR
uniref:Protein Wnt n=1 Tax=Haemonchus placei TaxID=6290 RepID=A0A158QNU3_HAEPC